MKRHICLSGVLLCLFMCHMVSAYAAEERTFFALPIAFYTSDTGFGLGAAAVKSYNDHLPRTSMIQFATLFTTKKQLNSTIKIEHYLRGGRDRLVFETSYQKFPTDFFGMGNTTENTDPETYTPETFEIEVFYDYNIFWSLNLRTSLRAIKFAIIETEEGRMLDSGVPPWSSGRFDAGPGIGLVWDSRDNTTSTNHGVFAKLHYNGQFLQNEGGAYNSIELDVRNFFEAPRNVILGTQFLFQNRQGDVPYYLLSNLGGQDRLRGYEQRRFIGNSLLLVQQDIRFPLFWRIGGSVFAAAGKVAPEPDELVSGQFNATFGIGGRFYLNREDGLVIRADYAQSDDNTGFYITFGEAY